MTDTLIVRVFVPPKPEPEKKIVFKKDKGYNSPLSAEKKRHERPHCSLDDSEHGLCGLDHNPVFKGDG